MSIITEIEIESRCENGICFCPDTTDEFNLFLKDGVSMVGFAMCGTFDPTKDCAPRSIYKQLLEKDVSIGWFYN